MTSDDLLYVCLPDEQASTEQRAYHSKEALEAKLDPHGLDKVPLFNIFVYPQCL
jgi:hypothetical protein